MNSTDRHHSILLLGDATNPNPRVLEELSILFGCPNGTTKPDLLVVEEPMLGNQEADLNLELYQKIGFSPTPETLNCRDLPGRLKECQETPVVLLRSSCAMELCPAQRNSQLRKALEKIAQETLLIGEGLAGSMLCHGTRPYNRLHGVLPIGATKTLLGLGLLPIDYISLGATVEIKDIKKAAETLSGVAGRRLVISYGNAGVICQINGKGKISALGEAFISRIQCLPLGSTTIDEVP